MTSEGLGEIFKGDSEDTCAGKFRLVPMVERADPSSLHRRGARTPIGTSGNFAFLPFHIEDIHSVLFSCFFSLLQFSPKITIFFILSTFINLVNIYFIIWAAGVKRFRIFLGISIFVKWANIKSLRQATHFSKITVFIHNNIEALQTFSYLNPINCWVFIFQTPRRNNL